MLKIDAWDSEGQESRLESSVGDVYCIPTRYWYGILTGIIEEENIGLENWEDGFYMNKKFICWPMYCCKMGLQNMHNKCK